MIEPMKHRSEGKKALVEGKHSFCIDPRRPFGHTCIGQNTTTSDSPLGTSKEKDPTLLEQVAVSLVSSHQVRWTQETRHLHRPRQIDPPASRCPRHSPLPDCFVSLPRFHSRALMGHLEESHHHYLRLPSRSRLLSQALCSEIVDMKGS